MAVIDVIYEFSMNHAYILIMIFEHYLLVRIIILKWRKGYTIDKFRSLYVFFCNFFTKLGMSMWYYEPICVRSYKFVFIFIACVVIFNNLETLSCAADVAWSEGNRVYVVVLRGSTTSIESGYITGLDEDLCRVEWDLCHCETLVPVEQLHRTPRAAQRAGAMQRTGEDSFHESAQSAGKMSLLYLLLSQRGSR